MRGWTDRWIERWLDRYVDKDRETDIHREIMYTHMDRIFNIDG
jgi:hypothetical protein